MEYHDSKPPRKPKPCSLSPSAFTYRAPSICRDAITLGKEIRARLPTDDAPCFVLIDEIQHAEPILPEGTDLSRLRPEDLYNELIRRDYAVDVGVVEMFATVDGKRCRRRYEVDFVVNRHATPHGDAVSCRLED